jgi:branched-chain amino acid transport system substrate-binding protein
MKMNSLLRIFAAFGSLSVAIQGATAQDTVKIGMVMPLSGPLAAAGNQVVAGARFYMRQHGDLVVGKKLELIVRDDMTTFDVGRRLIQELIVREKVNIIAGGTTGDLLASAAIITEAKKPTVIMLASTSTLIDKSPYFVRTSCTIAQSSTIVADWAAQQGLAKIVTFVTDFSPGHEAETTFKGRYLAAGGRVIEQVRVPLQTIDFTPFLQRARDANPQAVFAFVPSAQAGALAKQFAEKGLDKAGIKLIGPGDITDDELLADMGDAMLGTTTAHFYSAAHPSPTNKSFVTAFQKDQGVRPNFMVVSGYDGMHLIYEALRKTNGVTDGDMLTAVMRGTSWESPRGPTSIDQKGDVVHNIYMRNVEKVGGALYNVEFKTFEAVKNPLVAVH